MNDTTEQVGETARTLERENAELWDALRFVCCVLERENAQLRAALREIERVGNDPATKNPAFLARLASEALSQSR